VVAALIVVFKTRKKRKSRAPLPSRPPVPSREEARAEKKAEPPPSEKEVPKEAEKEKEGESPPEERAPREDEKAAPTEERPSAPTMATLDERAEEKAAAELEAARRERRLKRLRQGLAPTRGSLIKKIGNLFRAKKEIEPSLLEDLGDTLVSSDVGMKTTEWLLDLLKDALDKNELKDPEAVWDFLREEVRQVLSVETEPLDITKDKPYVILVVGVNGVGKTTTIGKLATQFIDSGHKVVLAAADTFRAAAVNQLEIWGKRAGAEVIKSKEGADPSSVVFDAIKHARETNADVVIADTAGRLHTKVPLMEEVKKIARVSTKAYDSAPHQILLVLDATTGQNAISQVEMFKEALDLTGLVVTKLDGTAKGGVVIGICHEHKIPIRFIGIGEAKDDLRSFEVEDFVSALFLRETVDH
jgi:fused signal recognition particle receptor